MARGPAIEIRPEHGYLALAGRRLALTIDPDDVMRVDSTTRLRPVSFGDRDRIVRDAIAAKDPADALLDAVVARSVVERGGLANGLLRLVAVALAGGEEPELPFAEAARRAGERHGWSWRQILEARGVVRRSCGGDAGGGWWVVPHRLRRALGNRARDARSGRCGAAAASKRGFDGRDVERRRHSGSPSAHVGRFRPRPPPVRGEPRTTDQRLRCRSSAARQPGRRDPSPRLSRRTAR